MGCFCRKTIPFFYYIGNDHEIEIIKYAENKFYFRRDYGIEFPG